MNHQPFRDWLFTDEKLSTEQHQLLQEHVTSCESCQQIKGSWQEVESTLLKASLARPQPGFTARWQIKLLDYEKKKQKQRSILSVGLITVLTTGFSALLIYLLWFFVHDPAPFLAIWFNQLVRLFSIFSIAQHMISPYAAVTPLVAFFSLIFLAGWVSFISVGWLAAYRKLSLARRTI